MTILDKLFELQDIGYKDFQCALMPTVDKERVIGVRTPALRKLAKEISRDEALAFMKELPHDYYEEDNLHAFLIERIIDVDQCFDEIERFLPYIDNWATCDSFSPKAITKNKERLLSKSFEWTQNAHEYTARYGIEMIMRHFLDDDFDIKYALKIASIVREEYYIKMMQAWYFATALAKQYESVVVLFEQGIILDPWVHNKAITKACESFRVKKDHKIYLKKLKNKTAE